MLYAKIKKAGIIPPPRKDQSVVSRDSAPRSFDYAI
jgi:hypothetical protein